MEYRTEYRIIGRFAKDINPHVVDWSPKWKEADAKARLAELEAREKRAKKLGEHVDMVGCIGISTPYTSDYALVDLKIQSRQVSKWN